MKIASVPDVFTSNITPINKTEANSVAEKVSSLEQYIDNSTTSLNKELEVNFENVVGQESLNRFDQNQRNKNKRRNWKRYRGQGR